MKPQRTMWAAIALVVATLFGGVAAAQPQLPTPRLPGAILVGPQWGGWANLGGSLTSAPTCLAPAENRIECYARDINGALQRRWWDGSAWNGWQTLPGVTMQMYDDGAGAGPSCFRDNAGMTHCVVWGSNGGLWHRWFPPGSAGWWEDLGGVFTSAPSCVAAPDQPTISCFGRGQNGALWQRVFNGNVWGPWTDRGGVLAPGTNPSCVARAGGRVDCIVVGTNNALHHQIMSGGVGGWRQISGNTVLTYASLPVSPRCHAAGNAVACYVPRGATPRDDTTSTLRFYLEGATWGVSDLGGDFGYTQVELSCLDTTDRLTYECFALLPGSPATIGSQIQPRLREFATSPATGASWRDAGIPTPPTANNSIHRLSCVSWGPGRIDCFSASSAGGPMMHVWRTPATPIGERFRRG